MLPTMPVGQRGARPTQCHHTHAAGEHRAVGGVEMAIATVRRGDLAPAHPACPNVPLWLVDHIPGQNAGVVSEAGKELASHGRELFPLRGVPQPERRQVRRGGEQDELIVAVVHLGQL